MFRVIWKTTGGLYCECETLEEAKQKARQSGANYVKADDGKEYIWSMYKDRELFEDWIE